MQPTYIHYMLVLLNFIDLFSFCSFAWFLFYLVCICYLNVAEYIGERLHQFAYVFNVAPCTANIDKWCIESDNWIPIGMAEKLR